MNGDQAPGMDGFSLAFIQGQEVSEEVIVNVLNEFHSKGMLERHLNATFGEWLTYCLHCTHFVSLFTHLMQLSCNCVF